MSKKPPVRKLDFDAQLGWQQNADAIVELREDFQGYVERINGTLTGILSEIKEMRDVVHRRPTRFDAVVQQIQTGIIGVLATACIALLIAFLNK